MTDREPALARDDTIQEMRVLCRRQLRAVANVNNGEEWERAVRMLGELHRAITRERRPDRWPTP
jgi:hypothetical protein